MTTQQANQRFALTVHAEGEVRDADGKLIPVSSTGMVEVSISELQGFSDDQLRAAGLDDSTIAKIRSTT